MADAYRGLTIQFRGDTTDLSRRPPSLRRDSSEVEREVATIPRRLPDTISSRGSKRLRCRLINPRMRGEHRHCGFGVPCGYGFYPFSFFYFFSFFYLKRHPSMMSLPRSASIQAGGMASAPYTMPASAPATAAVVSVSSPRLTARNTHSS